MAAAQPVHQEHDAVAIPPSRGNAVMNGQKIPVGQTHRSKARWERKTRSGRQMRQHRLHVWIAEEREWVKLVPAGTFSIQHIEFRQHVIILQAAHVHSLPRRL